jgi:hypothetical protein
MSMHTPGEQTPIPHPAAVQRTGRRRPLVVIGVVALLAGLAAVVVAVAVQLGSAPPSSTASPATTTAPPTPNASAPTASTPSVPTASGTPTATPTPPATAAPAPDMVAGYDARLLWDLCVARGQEEFPGAVASSEYELRYVHTTPDGVPEVYVTFDTPSDPMPTGTIWICQFGGDPASPTIDFFNAKDI